MKLGWFLVVAGGLFLLWRVLYTLMWVSGGHSANPVYDFAYNLTLVLIIGGIPLYIGIRRLKKHK